MGLTSPSEDKDSILNILYEATTHMESDGSINSHFNWRIPEWFMPADVFALSNNKTSDSFSPRAASLTQVLVDRTYAAANSCRNTSKSTGRLLELFDYVMNHSYEMTDAASDEVAAFDSAVNLLELQSEAKDLFKQAHKAPVISIMAPSVVSSTSRSTSSRKSAVKSHAKIKANQLDPLMLEKEQPGAGLSPNIIHPVPDVPIITVLGTQPVNVLDDQLLLNISPPTDLVLTQKKVKRDHNRLQVPSKPKRRKTHR